jgi:carboxymethylenebutenolidase
MAFEEYVQKEIVADCAEGYLTRREALRRLMVLGVGATAAGIMLAGCSDDDGDGSEADAATSTTLPPTTATTTGGAAAPAGPAPLATEPITFAGPAGELKGSWSAAAEPKGAVLIIHENTGLTPHFVSMPGRLAASGYSALAIDLVSRRGGTGAFTDSAQATAALSGADGIAAADLVADVRAGVEQVLHRTPGHTAGVMGFCFGGGMVWSLLAAGEQRVAAAVPFYGQLPQGADLTGAKAAVLAFYAENDTRVNDTRPAAAAALEAAKLTHEIVVEPATGHAFFNDTRPERYNAAAAADAYDRLLSWFGRHLS